MKAGKSLNAAIQDLLPGIIKESKKVVFNGNDELSLSYLNNRAGQEPHGPEEEDQHHRPREEILRVAHGRSGDRRPELPPT